MARVRFGRADLGEVDAEMETATLVAPELRRALLIATHFLEAAAWPPPHGVEVAIVVIAAAAGPLAPEIRWMCTALADETLVTRGRGVAVVLGELDHIVRRVSLQDRRLAKSIRCVARPGMATIVCVEPASNLSAVRCGRVLSLRRPAGTA